MSDGQTYKQRNNRRNAAFVNSLKMGSGCAGCDFVPGSEIECRLIDLHHHKGVKTVKLSRLVWGHAGLDRLAEEIAKGVWLCKLCHAREHAKAKNRI